MLSYMNNTDMADGPNCLSSPTRCSLCQSVLCLRKQVVNLMLDNIEEMYCLECLGKMNEKEPREILITAESYIMQRECFRKEWIKYENRSHCPEPLTCFINDCFGADGCGK
jgi:hypothetical protein